MRTEQVWTAVACLARDVEIKTFDDGGAIVNGRVLVNDFVNGKERTEGFNVAYRLPRHNIERLIAFNQRALKKGSFVWVTGALQSETYTDREGVERTAYTVRATALKILTSSRSPTASDADSNNTGDGESASQSADPLPVPSQPARRQNHAPSGPVPSSSAASDNSDMPPFDDPSLW